MTIIAGDVHVRDATAGDVDFIAWVMLAASRSQLERGIWEYLYAIDEEASLRFLAGAATTGPLHPFHHSLFQVAEVDGVPAAAMCGYQFPSEGFGVFPPVAEKVCIDQGVAIDGEFMHRLEVMGSGFPPMAAERLWVVENVATLPEFRRQGLVGLLLEKTLDRGRSLGFELAQIGVFIGNEPAKRAYLEAGFEVVAEARDPRWAEEIGCPGTEQLLRPLT